MREYDQIAEWYTSARSAIGVPDLEAFAATLLPRARVLDLGCGDGVPLTQLLVRSGLEVVALDSSAEMVRRFRVNLPGVPVRCERAEDARFEGGSFGAVVAWGVLFHLSETDQQTVLTNVAEWLMPGGRLLFTSGDVVGAREGVMDGVAFRYVSLGRDTYRRVLAGAGVRLVEDYSDAGGNHTYVAEKVA